jgi:hypothetical protein
MPNGPSLSSLTIQFECKHALKEVVGEATLADLRTVLIVADQGARTMASPFFIGTCRVHYLSASFLIQITKRMSQLLNKLL